MHIGRGMKLPVYVTGPMSHSWWAMAVVLLVAASLFIALVFSYLYIWTVAPEHWPPASGLRLPPVHWSLASALAFLLSGAAVALAGRLLAMVRKYGHWPARLSLAFGSLALAAALAIDFHSHWQSGLRPGASSYAALVYTVVAVESQLVVTAIIMGFYALARSAAGMLTAQRRATFDNTMLFWLYTVGQGLMSLLIVHGFPRVAG